MQRLGILIMASMLLGCPATRPPAQTQHAASTPAPVIAANLPFAAVSLVAAERQPTIWTPTPHFAIDSQVDIVLVGESEEATAGISGRVGHFQTDLQPGEATLTWEFGGGATLDSATEGAAYVTFGEPGAYTGTLSASTGGRKTQHPFEYVVVPNIRSVKTPGDITVLPRNNKIRLTAVTSHPAQVVEWRWRNFLTDFSAKNTANGESIDVSFTNPGPVGQNLELRSGDGAGHFGDWRSFEFGLERDHIEILKGTCRIPSGKEGDIVECKAYTKEPYSKMEWDFQDGAVIVGGTSLAPRVKLGAPGEYTGMLLVTHGSTTAFAICNFYVEGRTPYDWQRLPLTLDAPPVTDPAATVLDGKPVISWGAPTENPDTLDHWIAIASVPDPRQPDDWVVSRLDVRSSSRWDAAPQRLLVHDGRLQFLTDSAEAGIVWASARTKEPKSPADWNLRQLPGSEPTAFGFIANRPIYAVTSGGNLQLHQGLVAEPAGLSDWTSLLIPVKQVAYDPGPPFPLFFELDNRLIVPYDTRWGMHILVADTNIPTSLEQLSAYQLSNGNKAGVVGFARQNRLLLRCQVVEDDDYDYKAWTAWLRATVAVPESAGNWTTAPIPHGTNAPSWGNALLIDGKPVVIMVDDTLDRQITTLLYSDSAEVDSTRSWTIQQIGGNLEFSSVMPIGLETAAGPLLIHENSKTEQAVLLYPK